MLSLNDYYFKLKPSSGSGSVTPTGTLEVTKNGLYDVVNYGKANVNVEGSINVVKSGGTVVPNSGYVDRVYFNTKLNVEEVVSILSQLTYDERGMYNVLSTLDDTNNSANTILIATMNGMYMIGDITTQQYFFSSSADAGLNFVGWNPNLANTLEINAENQGSGAENDKLTDLISATPFESKVIKELSGDYEAVDIVLNELSSGSTPLENNLNVEKIYFNTNLTTEEVDAILDTLTLDSYLSYTINYQRVNGTTTSHTHLNITKAEAYVSGTSGYAILQSTNALLYASNETVSNFVSSYLGISAKVGWNVSELETTNGTILDVGVDGDKLTQLFSATPFVEPNTIDLEQYLDNKQMPMSVTVNVGGSSVSPMKLLLDGRKSADNLFNGFSGESIDDIISYSDTENVTSMNSMFNNCKALTTIPQLDTSNVTNMGSIFKNCYKLTAVSQLDTSNVTNMNSMFNNCMVLQTIPQLDTSNVTNMGYMFNNCYKLTAVSQLDTSNVTNAQFMFNGCSALTAIPQLDTSNVTSMNDMFNSCSVLKTIPQINMIKVKSDSNASNMVINCRALTNLTLLNIKVNLKLGSGDGTGSWDYGHLLTLESLINTVKELINVGSAKTLTMGTANLEKIASTYVKFTDSSVTSIPTNEKGDVVVCESTDTGAMLLSDYALLKNWTLA